MNCPNCRCELTPHNTAHIEHTDTAGTYHLTMCHHCAQDRINIIKRYWRELVKHDQDTPRTG